MDYEYTSKKKKYELENIERAQILFLNGDFIEISGKEILGLEISLYDRLVHFNNCYVPFVKSGFIKMKISNKKPKYDGSSVYNEKEYGKARKSYIENRCIEEGGFFAIRFFDDLNWADTILGNIIVEKDSDFLIVSFLEYPSLGSSAGENYVINLKDVNKKDFRVVCLDFENCDGIDVYQDEIKEIKLNFEKNLEWNSEGYIRVVRNGFIRLKFNKDYNDGRKANIYVQNYRPTIKDLEKRICGKGEDVVDICHLYVSNYFCGYGMEKEEEIETKDLSEYSESPTNEDNEGVLPYVSGYAKKQKDGSIIIHFGKRLSDV